MDWVVGFETPLQTELALTLITFSLRQQVVDRLK